jgi:hypothetical protein
MFRVCISSRLLQVIAFEFSVFTPKIVTLLLIWEWLGHINWFQCLLNFIRWLLGFPYGLRCYRISVISWFHLLRLLVLLELSLHMLLYLESRLSLSSHSRDQ